jgi:hypothetical protein
MEIRCSTGTQTIRAGFGRRIKAEEVEKALSNDPIPIYEQAVEGEMSAAKRSESSPRTTWMPGRRRITSPGTCEESEAMKEKTIIMPKAGALRDSRLVGQLKKVASVQIALRLPEPDIAKA